MSELTEAGRAVCTMLGVTNAKQQGNTLFLPSDQYQVALTQYASVWPSGRTYEPEVQNWLRNLGEENTIHIAEDKDAPSSAKHSGTAE